MVALATAVAILDVFFILVAVPESLPEKVRVSPISWEQADPFSSLRNVGQDPTILLLCITVFLSYLPEAGQYSCIFVYLKLVMDWSAPMVAVFVGLVGLLAVLTQLCLGLSIFCTHTHPSSILIFVSPPRSPNEKFRLQTHDNVGIVI